MTLRIWRRDAHAILRVRQKLEYRDCERRSQQLSSQVTASPTAKIYDSDVGFPPFLNCRIFVKE